MANKIDANMTQQYLNITGASGRGAKADATHANPAERGDTEAPAPKGATDTVELTRSARDLQALETALGNVGEVDQARVDAIKAKLEAGTYEASSARTADKMLAFDRTLPQGE